MVLEQKYGLQLDQNTTDLLSYPKREEGRQSGSEERIYHCDCLGPVWPS